MSEPELWAKTEQQIARVQAARGKGGLRGWCGRQLDPGETVYWVHFGLDVVRRAGGAVPLWPGVRRVGG